MPNSLSPHWKSRGSDESTLEIHRHFRAQVHARRFAWVGGEGVAGIIKLEALRLTRLWSLHEYRMKVGVGEESRRGAAGQFISLVSFSLSLSSLSPSLPPLPRPTESRSFLRSQRRDNSRRGEGGVRVPSK
jgi:hypothetical protein